MKTLNFIGCGKVGQALGTLWHRNGVFAIGDVLTRSATSAAAACTVMGAGSGVANPGTMRPADLWCIATPDAHIAQAVELLMALQPALSPATVFHCSGAQSSGVLAPLQQTGWSVASVHCILSFASVHAAVAQFPGTACALEGELQAVSILRPAMQAIGAQCFEIAARDKVLYHAAAVFATNFIPVLQGVAEAAWRTTGVPPAVVEQLRATLLRNAADNITRLGPAGALTGPAARGDVGAIERQSAVVRAWSGDAGDAYDALSALALRMAKTASDAQANSASGT